MNARRQYYNPGQNPRPRKGELVPVKPAADPHRPLTRRALEREQRKGKP